MDGPVLTTKPLTGVDPRHHLTVLDGWRGASILLVLTAHLIPFGRINDSIGVLGMVLFFNLSGFLIVSLLLKKNATVTDFAIRRFLRIIPLAWLYLGIVFVFQEESARAMLAHFMFVANLPPKDIRLATDHLWSLCVEVQFYVGIIVLFGFFRARGLLVLPLIAIAVTIGRIVFGVTDSSVTWFRIDEILAGGTLALLVNERLGRLGTRAVVLMQRIPQTWLLLLLAVSSLHGFREVAWITYLRPYLGALLIGATLLNHQTSLVRALDKPWLHRIAAISYSLYVIHIGLTYTWLGSGDFVERYSKRPLLFLVLFVLAYVSTYYYEHPAIAAGRRLTRWIHRVPAETSKVG